MRGLLVAQRARQLDVHPPDVLRRPHEPDALRVRLRRQPARPVDDVRQALVLGAQRVRPRVAHLPAHDDGTLQVELRLLHDQHVVVRVERHLGRPARRNRHARWPHEPAIGCALEQIRRVERHAHRRGQLPARAVLGEPRDLGFLQVRADRRPAREVHEVPQRHARPPREASRLVDAARDRDVVRFAQGRDRVDHHGVAIHQGYCRDTDARCAQRCRAVTRALPVTGRRARGHAERDIQGRTGRPPRSALGSAQDPVHGHAL